MEKIIQESPGLTVKDLIAEQVEAYLQKRPIQPGSDLYTYAYQWANWNDGVNSKVHYEMKR